MKVEGLAIIRHNQPNAKEEMEDIGHCDKISIKIPGLMQFNVALVTRATELYQCWRVVSHSL